MQFSIPICRKFLCKTHTIFSYFRAIFYPFHENWSKCFVILIVFAITVLSLIIYLPYSYHTVFVERTIFNIYLKTEATHYGCVYSIPNDSFYAYYPMLRSILTNYLPLCVITLSHIIMFRKVRGQTIQLENNRSAQRMRRLRAVSITFMITVAGFFACTFPHHVFLDYLHSQSRSQCKSCHDTLNDLLTLLVMFQCCLNPFIYSKIHRIMGLKIRQCFQKTSGRQHTENNTAVLGRTAEQSRL